jgi:hypothetical protein
MLVWNCGVVTERNLIEHLNQYFIKSVNNYTLSSARVELGGLTVRLEETKERETTKTAVPVLETSIRRK